MIYQKYRESKRAQGNVSHRDDKVQFDPKTDQGIEGTDFYVQDWGTDNYGILMEGYAVRLGNPTNPPVINKVGNRVVKLDESHKNTISDKIVSNIGNCPVHLTTWRIRYRLLVHLSEI